MLLACHLLLCLAKAAQGRAADGLIRTDKRRAWCAPEVWEVRAMKRDCHCKHERTRFHSIQRLGDQPPIELRQCLLCDSTIAVRIAEPAAAGVAASH